MRPKALVILSLATGPTMSGCIGPVATGSLRAQALGGQRGTLSATYRTAVYEVSDKALASFYLSDVPTEDLLAGKVESGQFLHIDLLWLPKAGRTPLDPSAANIAVRLVILADDEYGIYGGSGFAIPDEAIGNRRIEVGISHASLTLLESSDGFVDRLGPGRLRGRFSVRRDETMSQRVRFAASQIVTNRAGEPRRVRDDPNLRDDSRLRFRALSFANRAR